MPAITYQSRTWTCAAGTNLRLELLRHEMSPYNGAARWVNCRGLGTCGTCAVEVAGTVTPMTSVERWRLGFPPHRAGSGLRLACQCRVLGDVIVKKHSGFWGQHMENES